MEFIELNILNDADVVQKLLKESLLVCSIFIYFHSLKLRLLSIFYISSSNNIILLLRIYQGPCFLRLRN